MKLSAIIVAGGSGTRMGAEIPKQFMPIGGRPILMHTIDAFAAYADCSQIIVVLPEVYVSYWKSVCSQFDFGTVHTVVFGGQSRFHSVASGLSAVADDADLVAVHDGVRPFAGRALIGRVVEAAEAAGAAIPVVRPSDSMRILDDGGSRMVDRSRYVMVQTPQIFGVDVIRKAYRQPFCDTFTDDASVVEASGHPVSLVDGDVCNIKITMPMDILVAEAYLQKAGTHAV